MTKAENAKIVAKLVGNKVTAKLITADNRNTLNSKSLSPLYKIPRAYMFTMAAKSANATKQFLSKTMESTLGNIPLSARLTIRSHKAIPRKNST